LLADIEQTRLAVTNRIDRKKRAMLGQFFTPIKISRFMAGLFEQNGTEHCRLLDAGAGVGSLIDAFLERCFRGDFNYESMQVDAFEIDHSLRPYLEGTINKYKNGLNFVADIRYADFIHVASDWLSESLFGTPPPLFTHAILNPPYKKIRSNSEHRLALRRAGIETVNLYSAFVALALSLLEEKGQLVAIIPRSFCNGPYYGPFREHILRRSAIKHIHLFGSRSKAFKDDDVLQENIIIKLECGVKQGDVRVSTSTDDSFDDLSLHNYPFDQIVLPDDPGHFIHVPTSPETAGAAPSSFIHYSLSEIGISVSTGPVVDFRLKEHLRDMPEPGTSRPF